MIEMRFSKPLATAEGTIELEIDAKIEAGDFVALSGRSGSGKTTLLRILAGLERPETGRIVIDDEVWLDTEKGINLTTQKRQIGFVFQDYSLFPHMSVRENILFANNDPALADELLELVELTAMADRYPATLSGGQQQRVALARAIARRPKLLLLDEPLSALDPQTRSKLQNEIVAIHKRFGTTTLMVSHDMSEIFKLARRVMLLERGVVTKDASPETLFIDQPSTNKFSFVGELLQLRPTDILVTAVIGIGNQVVEAVLTKEEASALSIGDKVMIASKAFNPIVKKLD